MKSPHLSFSSRSGALLAACSVILTLVCTEYGFAQKSQPTYNNLGKEFYVTYPSNQGTPPTTTDPSAIPVMALYLTSRTAATGTVTVPALNFTKAFTTNPGQITTVLLPSDDKGGPTVEVTQPEQILSGMAVHVLADTDIAIYGVNHKWYSSDAFMGLPTRVLGTEYRAMCYTTDDSNETAGEFAIVGTMAGTTVTITPYSNTIGGHLVGVPFTIALNAGDVYLVQDNGVGDQDGTEDLTGSLIESDLPVAVFSGHQRTAIPIHTLDYDGSRSRNNLLEQMPPVSAWGDSAFIIPFATSQRPDLVRVISAEDNNQISVNGNPVGTFAAGQFYEITAVSGVTTIRATNPILVGQYMHTSWGDLNGGFGGPPSHGDPCLAIDFPVEQFDTQYTILSIQNSAFSSNFVNIVVDQSGIPTMTLDGAAIPVATFLPIAGSTHEYAQITLQQGTHNLKCSKPFGATVYALGQADAYSYTGGSQIRTITPLQSSNLVIDFGDRLISPTLQGKFDTTVPLRNISEIPVAILGFLNRIGDVTKFSVTNPAATVAQPDTIQAFTTDSMTIEFNPQQAGKRMHTQLTANTEHLRAYVVDLYGRGVLDGPASFADSTQSIHIDTVDFGMHVQSDPPIDTIIYIGNIGSAKTTIDSMSITGVNANYFQRLTPNALPFAVDTGHAPSQSIKLQFTPAGPNGQKVAVLNALSQNGMPVQVVLLADIETVFPASLGGVPTFDTLLTCNSEDKSVAIQDPDNRAITLDSVVIQGANASDFALDTQVPLTLQAFGNSQINIKFAPNGDGLRNAVAILYFNVPLGTVDTVQLQGVGASASIMFAEDQNIHILTGEPFSMTVRALSNLTPFKANGYTLTLDYDSTYITFDNVSQDNTHSYWGYFTPGGIPGHDQLTYQCLPDSLVWGGGMQDSTPLVYLNFTSSTNGNPTGSFYDFIHIGVDVQLANAVLAGPCVLSVSPGGAVTLDSTCGKPGLILTSGPPQTMDIEPTSPNPFSATTSFLYGIPQDGNVYIVVRDVLGRTVREVVNQYQKAGYYSARIDGSTLPSGMFFVTIYSGGTARTQSVMVAR